MNCGSYTTLYQVAAASCSWPLRLIIPSEIFAKRPKKNTVAAKYKHTTNRYTFLSRSLPFSVATINNADVAERNATKAVTAKFQ